MKPKPARGVAERYAVMLRLPLAVHFVLPESLNTGLVNLVRVHMNACVLCTVSVCPRGLYVVSPCAREILKDQTRAPAKMAFSNMVATQARS